MSLIWSHVRLSFTSFSPPHVKSSFWVLVVCGVAVPFSFLKAGVLMEMLLMQLSVSCITIWDIAVSHEARKANSGALTLLVFQEDTSRQFHCSDSTKFLH